MLGMINKTLEDCNISTANGAATMKVEPDDLACLERFQSRTVLSLGTSITGQVYQQQIIKLVYQVSIFDAHSGSRYSQVSLSSTPTSCMLS